MIKKEKKKYELKIKIFIGRKCVESYDEKYKI
jgi:hypothetical protein